MTLIEKPIKFDLKEWSNLEDGLGLIAQLFLPNEQKSPRGHLMKLVHDQSTLDHFKWISRDKVSGKRDRKECNYR